MWYTTLFLVALVALIVDGTPSIYFCPSDEWSPETCYTPEPNEYKDPSSVIRQCDKLCADGNWALFTKVNWGAGYLNTTLVYPVQGSSPPKNCATGVKSILSKIRSIRPLGVMASAVGTPQLTAFKKAYFLEDADVSSSTGILYDSTQKPQDDIRSLAFAKELVAAPSNSIVVCFRDSESCMCYNENADVMIPDVKTLTTKKQLVDCISKTAVECPNNRVLKREDPKMCPDTFTV